MKHLRHIVTCSLILLFTVEPNLVSRDAEDACLMMVRRIYRKLTTVSDPEQIFHAVYRIRTDGIVGGKSVSSEASVDLVMNSRRLQMVSADMEVYQDDQVMVTVIPGRRLLYIADSDLERFRQQQGKLLNGMQDTLFANSRVESCQEVKGEDGRRLKRVVLSMPEGARRTAGLSRATITVDEERERVKRVEVDLEPSSRIRHIDMKIERVDYGYRSEAFSRTILEGVYESVGKLRSRYRGYRVEDVRVKGRK